MVSDGKWLNFGPAPPLKIIPLLAHCGHFKFANINHRVDFWVLGDPFGPHGTLSFEIFQIEPFLTKLWKIFIFWGLLFSKLTT